MRSGEPIVIEQVDPRGRDAMALLRQAAVEARRLYPESSTPGDRWPTNSALQPGGVYLVAYLGDQPVACGAIERLDDHSAEVRRMFVVPAVRRRGYARAILTALEEAAASFGYTRMLLETGNRQVAAMGLYASHGFERTAPFGKYATDPTSICYEKDVQAAGSGPAVSV